MCIRVYNNELVQPWRQDCHQTETLTRLEEGLLPLQIKTEADNAAKHQIL